MKEKAKEILDITKQRLQDTTDATLAQILIIAGLVSILFFLIGWMVFGWLLAPVQWEYPEKMNGLEYGSKGAYVLVVSEWYAYSQNDQKLQYFLSQMDDIDLVACSLSQQTSDMAEWSRFVNLAWMKNGYGCE